MRNKIVVSAVQMQIESGNIAANLKNAEKWVGKIFEKGRSDLIVFPEDSVSGALPDRIDLAQEDNSSSLKFFRELASSYKTYIVCGSFIKSIKDKFYNTSLLIDPKGEIVLEYHKNNLWHSEREKLSFGNGGGVVETEIGKIGIIICWDVAFPETCRALAKKGAEIICCPSYWTREKTDIFEKHKSGSEKIFINSVCSARAIENEVLFVFSNASLRKGFVPGVNLDDEIGQTQICTPLSGAVARIDDNSEGFVTYAYDPQMAFDAEKIFKIRRDLRERYD